MSPKWNDLSPTWIGRFSSDSTLPRSPSTRIATFLVDVWIMPEGIMADCWEIIVNTSDGLKPNVASLFWSISM